jgi:hypothetical protein
MIYRCDCGRRFNQAIDYASHLQDHPAKCRYCDDWFHGLEDVVKHKCKREDYALNRH